MTRRKDDGFFSHFVGFFLCFLVPIFVFFSVITSGGSNSVARAPSPTWYDFIGPSQYTLHTTAPARQAPTSAPLITAYAFTPVKKSSTVASYYRDNYPMTWGYIRKYASDPDAYVEYYDSVWGDLQAYHGDGIPFDTLNPFERSLVNFPPADSCIYLSSLDASSYHATKYCYTLLRSDVIPYSSYYTYLYDPCSKCVR